MNPIDTHQPMNGEALSILLVEDNPDHAELVKRAMESHRVMNSISHVSDGEEALDYLLHRGAFSKTKQIRPHVVLLDLNLPRLSGLEVLRFIKESDDLCSIPVVILSTSQADQDVAQAYKFKANSYLMKPVEFEKFETLMSAFGFYWLGWNVHPWKT